MLPVTPELHGQAFVVRLAGRLHATPLLVALLVLELSDIVFAVDSVPAIFAITREPLLVFTSNVCAILGLRAMYFLLADAVQRFHLLHYGLALVLVFVGLKMVWLDGAAGGKLPIEWSLGVIVALLAGAVAASLLVPPRRATAAAWPGRRRVPDEGALGAAPVVATPARARMPSVTTPTLSMPAALAASITLTTSWYGRLGAPTRNTVFSRRVAKISRSVGARPASSTCCLLTAIWWSAVISTTICGSGALGGGACASAGRSMSVPFCVIGSAAMKITSSTSRTSMSGVTFMSALRAGRLGASTASAPRCFLVT